MSYTFVAKPIKVKAFQVGTDKDPAWFLKARRLNQVKVLPARGMVVAMTEAGVINYYDPKTFNSLFETLEESLDLNNDGVIDTREKAIASETEAKQGESNQEEETEEEDEVLEESSEEDESPEGDEEEE
jgi:hypothetical protein